jgi:RHS repeat-associated protein
MPGRIIQDGEPYRYAFQGQEKDPETGKEAFQLRLWDGRIGRWLTTDPYGQYASPYLGMGNNPINSIDPDGGFTQWLDSGGNVVHDDGINNGIVYRVNDGFSFNGDIGALTSNSKLLVDKWKFVGSDSDLKWLVKSQFKFIDNFSTNSFDFNVDGGGKHALSVSPLSSDDFDELSKVSGAIQFGINKTSRIFGNVYNLRSGLEHEKRHIEQGFLGEFYFGLDADNVLFHQIREIDAYHFQMKGKWFSKATSSFQNSTKINLWTNYKKPFLEKMLNMKLPSNPNEIFRNN